MPLGEPLARDRQLDDLIQTLGRAVNGHGGIVFLEGETGSGKSFLLEALVDEVEERRELEEMELLNVSCSELGAHDPLQPFGEILRKLTERDRRRTKAKRIAEIVKEVAPPLLEVIPVLGKASSLVVRAGSTVAINALGGDTRAEHAQRAPDIAETLLGIAQKANPLALVIDDAHWIDADSCEVIRRLARSIERAPLVIVLSFDPDYVGKDHPLARTKAAAPLVVRTMHLGALSAEEIGALVQQRFGSELDPSLAEWLHDVCEGNLTFVALYLAALEEQGAIRRDGDRYVLSGAIAGARGDWRLSGELAALPTPETIRDVLRPRLAPLDEDELELLVAGSVQGQRFLSSVLVSVLKAEEKDVLDRLHKIREARRLISFDPGEDWWSARSAGCRFDPRLLRDLLYERFEESQYERETEHRAVAQALEALLEGEERPPRSALLEIAAHYSQANEPLAATRLLLQAAESTYREGAFRETAALTAQALELLGAASDGQRDDRLFAEAVALHLVASEDRWRLGEQEEAGRRLGLAVEAEEAAMRVGDPRVQSSVRYAKGLLLCAFDRLPAGIAELQGARELARQAGDPVGEFTVLVDLGHALDSQDLRAGRDILREADKLLASGALDPLVDERTRALSRARLDSAIGVAEFDLGNYGEALRLLPSSLEQLRRVRVVEEGAWTLSFLAQLYTAVGQFEAAEKAIEEGLGLFADEAGVVGVRGYLRSLLGRLYVEWEPQRLDDAAQPLVDGRGETADAGHRGVSGLVDGYYAAYLLSFGDEARAREADELLARSIEGSDEGGWHRSAVASRALRARAALALGRTDDARALSTEAVELLEAQGGHVPAVRTEEILFTHGRVLDAAGTPEAASWYRRAAEVVNAKAETLDDPAHKQSFLTDVRLSREILAAAE